MPKLRDRQVAVRAVPISDVAARWGLSVETVRRWISEGRLIGYKPGGKWLVDPAEVEGLVLSSSSRAVAAPG